MCPPSIHIDFIHCGVTIVRGGSVFMDSLRVTHTHECIYNKVINCLTLYYATNQLRIKLCPNKPAKVLIIHEHYPPRIKMIPLYILKKALKKNLADSLELILYLGKVEMFYLRTS